MSQHLMIIGLSLGDTRNWRFRNQEHVRGRLRSNIMEGDDEIVFVNNLRGNFPSDDSLKESLAHKYYGRLEANLLNNQTASSSSSLQTHGPPQELDNLFTHRITARPPSLSARQPFHATSQPMKANHFG